MVLPTLEGSGVKNGPPETNIVSQDKI